MGRVSRISCKILDIVSFGRTAVIECSEERPSHFSHLQLNLAAYLHVISLLSRRAG